MKAINLLVVFGFLRAIIYAINMRRKIIVFAHMTKAVFVISVISSFLFLFIAYYLSASWDGYFIALLGGILMWLTSSSQGLSDKGVITQSGVQRFILELDYKRVDRVFAYYKENSMVKLNILGSDVETHLVFDEDVVDVLGSKLGYEKIIFKE